MLKPEHVTVATWNVQWRRTGSEAAATIRDRLAAHQPDVVCLTEAPADFLDGDGHSILCSQDTGYPIIGNRRKVVLWSRNGWSDVDSFGCPGLPSGRFVAGTTETPASALRVIGVCIPWAASHVSTGHRDRRRWEDHLRYLDSLSEVLEHQPTPYFLIGDFNQAFQRRTAPRGVYSSLLSTLEGKCRIITAGEIDGCGFAIDHIALSDGLEVRNVAGLSAKLDGGPDLSDHFGVVGQLILRS